MKERLSSLTNAATVVVALAIVAHIGVAQYDRYQNRPRPPYAAGDVIKDTTELALKHAKMTVLLGTSSTCQYCREAMPFYGRIRAAAMSNGVRLVAYTRENLEANQQFLNDHDLEVDAVVSAVGNGVRLEATPTVVLVGQKGQVMGAWRGSMTQGQEDELLKLIGES